MAGVSVQAFRRQGRRFGAGLVCSEMVSCAGLSLQERAHARLPADRRRRAPARGADLRRRARRDGRGGADGRGRGRGHRRHQLRLPRPQGDEDRRGRDTASRSRTRACAIVDAVANAVSLPVSVKMRRGLANGSRTCLEIGPQLVEAGAASLTLHPRSAKQMYTGEADHSLTAELVELVDVPVIASGDITSRARAQTVLATTGAAAVMVGRAAQGNPWALQPDHGRRRRAIPRGGRRRARALHARDHPRARRAARDRVPEEVLRLVPRPRAVPAARSSRSSSSSRRSTRSSSACSRPLRARGSCSSGSRTSCRRATRCSSTSRSRSTAAAECRGRSTGSRSIRPGHARTRLRHDRRRGMSTSEPSGLRRSPRASRLVRR